MQLRAPNACRGQKPAVAACIASARGRLRYNCPYSSAEGAMALNVRNDGMCRLAREVAGLAVDTMTGASPAARRERLERERRIRQPDAWPGKFTRTGSDARAFCDPGPPPSSMVICSMTSGAFPDNYRNVGQPRHIARQGGRNAYRGGDRGDMACRMSAVALLEAAMVVEGSGGAAAGQAHLLLLPHPVQHWLPGLHGRTRALHQMAQVRRRGTHAAQVAQTSGRLPGRHLRHRQACNLCRERRPVAAHDTESFIRRSDRGVPPAPVAREGSPSLLHSPSGSGR